jgi:hypothetical protein
MGMGRASSTHEEKRNAYRALDIREVGWGDIDWINVPQDM